MGRPFVQYRRDLKGRARSLRRDATPAERKLWFDFLRAHRLKFTRQKPLRCYVADFYCAQRKVVIEVDGDTHYTYRGEHYDAVRTAALAEEGILVLRFTNIEVMRQFEAVCQRIEEVLSSMTDP
jgi:very-short-patch-repair endonuclease